MTTTPNPEKAAALSPVSAETVEAMAEALRCWKLFMPITDGDTLYSGHPKVMTVEALARYEAEMKGGG